MEAEKTSPAGSVPQSEPGRPLEIFYSYAHTDEALRQELLKHLALLQRQGRIISWHDRQIIAGSNWQDEISVHLESADIILLLISADFLASDYCYGIEMERALQRERAGEARVIPILLRSVYWKNAPFAHLQVLPTGANAVDSPHWHNHDEAFTNVVEGLNAVIADITNISSGNNGSPAQSSGPRLWMVPFPRNPLFTGRQEVLQRLHDALKAQGTAALTQPATQAISGLGGIGKTQTALEYAYRHRSAYQYVFWVRSETEQELASDYSTIASLLNLRESRQPDQKQQIAAVKNWLQTHTGWLLILDNADDLRLAYAFLPPDFPGHVILTTRASAPGRIAHKIDIERMEPAEGILFLLRRARFLAEHAPLDAAPPTQQTQARAIVQEVDGLPLALEQAGAYIEETRCGLDGYLRDYQTQRAALLNHRGGTLHPDYRETVATTWTLAFQKVEAASPAAADLLRLCAFLSPDSIPEEIITEGAPHLGPTLKALSDPYHLNAALAELLKYSLIKRDPTTHILSLHRLVQAVLLDTLPTRTHRTWATRATHALYEAFPKVEYATWPQCQRLLPSAQVCAALIEQYKLAFKESVWLLNNMAHYLYQQGQYTQALPLFQRALEIDEQLSGFEHADTAISLNNLALLYSQLGQYAQAEPLYQRALAIYEKTRGPDHPDAAATLNNLGQLYHNQGNYEQAEQYYQRALDIQRRVLGQEHPDIAITLASMGGLYQRQGRYEEAEALYRRALAIKEKVFGPEHYNAVNCLEQYASLLRATGRGEEARVMAARTRGIRERWRG